ncbi:MAG: Hint domain-containing protein, partial [Paracoccaceae bacterium]|nr:Hint domain-containing protein [Paracoccaceae bacterium]
YCGSGFNDAVGVWVNGEAAQLTVGDGDITINNINDESNANLYIDNHHNDDVANTEMDGFTVTLTLKAPVNSGETNTIKISIADGGDAVYDSNLLIAGNSVQTALVANDDVVEIVGGSTSSVNVLDNDGAGGDLTITHINGQAVSVGDTVTLATGEKITLSKSGTFEISSSGAEASNTFSYSIEDEFGNTDSAFVTISTTPCFVAGTLIQTPFGLHKVDELKPGDLVMTRDHGPQPLRWIGFSHRRTVGADAPIIFEKCALGAHHQVAFSPNHRVIIRSPIANMLFGGCDVLVKAAHLVNGTTIRRKESDEPITYCHLLFDRHEIVNANGLESESYHPGVETLGSFDQCTRSEIEAFFPNFLKLGYGPTARPCLKAHEGRVLAHACGMQ